MLLSSDKNCRSSSIHANLLSGSSCLQLLLASPPWFLSDVSQSSLSQLNLSHTSCFFIRAEGPIGWGIPEKSRPIENAFCCRSQRWMSELSELKTWAILLPRHVPGCCLRIVAGPSFLTHMFNILYTYQLISSHEAESLITCRRCAYEIPRSRAPVRVVRFGGWLMCLSPLCCFPSFVSCCCLDRHGLAGDRNKWVR